MNPDAACTLADHTGCSTAVQVLCLLAAAAAGLGIDEVIARIARGERGALHSAYDAFAGRAMAIALGILRSTEEAEEVVQETFVEVWRRAGEYRKERGTPGAWIAAMARNRAIDRLRERTRDENTIRTLAAQPPREPDPPPSESAARQQERTRVRVALDALPPEQRRTLELAYFVGLTQSEIARATGDALGTVKTRIRLGMEKLAEALLETRP